LEASRRSFSRRTCNCGAAKSSFQLRVVVPRVASQTQLPFWALRLSSNIVFKVAASTVVPSALPSAFSITYFYPLVCCVGSMGQLEIATSACIQNCNLRKIFSESALPIVTCDWNRPVIIILSLFTILRIVEFLRAFLTLSLHLLGSSGAS
jgi:hypothetical protein